MNFNQNNGAIFFSAGGFDGYSAVALLWMLYDYTGQDLYRRYALEGTKSFAPASQILHTHCGICMYRTAAWGYALTADDGMKALALKAAQTFCEFWDPQNEVFCRRPGQAVARFPQMVQHRSHSVFDGIRRNAMETHSWETAVDYGGFWFEILWWAAKYDPSYRDYAIKHCESILRLGMIRQDGSSYHILSFNSQTGQPEKLHAHQAYSDETTWSRGQAWVLMTYAQAYEATGTDLFLDTFLRCADYWIKHLPEDYIPFYDMSDPRVPHVPRDSCAAVIAMNSMIRVCQKNPALEPRFKPVINATLRELYDFYLTPGGLVLHGSWGADHEPLFEGILHFGNLYLPDAVYMALMPDRFTKLRGF